MSKSDEALCGEDINSHQSFDGTLGTETASTATYSSHSHSSRRRSIRRFRRSSRLGAAGSDDVRKRYLYRLGISDTARGSDVPSDRDGSSRSGESYESGSLSVEVNTMNDCHRSFDCLQTSRTHSGSRMSRPDSSEGKVLLRKSVQYTTELKFDKSDPTDIEKTSRHGAIAAPLSPSSCASKFELSTAWTNHLLSIGENSDTSKQPLDGAFDLFSLPSDSSIASSRNRAITNNATSTDSLTEPSTSLNSNTPDFLSSSFSFHSIHREINQMHSMSLSDHSIQPRRKVSFDSTVKATTIPARFSYSQRVRTKLWSSSEDIVNNAIRNEFEFSFDGSDWRRIREEKDFISVAPLSEEKLHPAHFYGRPNSSRSMPVLPSQDNSPLLERGESSSDDDGSDMHFCGVFGMEMNTD
jgi:hypothetical protein